MKSIYLKIILSIAAINLLYSQGINTQKIINTRNDHGSYNCSFGAKGVATALATGDVDLAIPN